MNNRRQVLQASGGLVAGLGLAGCGGSQAATNSNPAFVLVHGAWHGASCFGKLIPEMAALGFTAVAVDLPGHGLDAKFPASYVQRPLNNSAFATEISPIADVTVEQSADAVINVIDQLLSAGFPGVILVGHSMGGVTITRVVERVPSKVSAVVYLTAFMLSHGQTVLDATALPENASSEIARLFLSDPEVSRAVRIDPNSSDEAYRAKCRSALYGDVPAAQINAVLNLLTPDEPLSIGATPTVRTAANWGGVRRHYIKCLQDRTITPALQQRFVEDADKLNGRLTIVHSLDSSHSPFLSMPRMLAQILSKAAS